MRLVRTGLLVLASALPAQAQNQFRPGDIYIGDFPSKACVGPYEMYPGDRIWKVDPNTGVVQLFVELRGAWCGGIESLIFTPDGTRLRVAQLIANRIIELDADGNPSILYSPSNGFNIVPIGSSCMAYDRDGNFYVSGFERIVRYPVGSNVWENFADRFTNPLMGRSGGAISIDSAGDLYFGGFGSAPTYGNLLRFQGPHNGTLIEVLEGMLAKGITSDSCGSTYLLVYTESSPGTDHAVWSYSNGDPITKQLVTRFVGSTAGAGISLDPTESVLYLGGSTQVYRVPTGGGIALPFAEIDGGLGFPDGSGFAVVPEQNPGYGFTPCPPPIPTVSAWGTAVLLLFLLIGAKLAGWRSSRQVH